MKRGFLIYFIILGLFFVPRMVFAQQYNRTASVGRSAVMNTSNVYYYTDWKLLDNNSLNAVPIPYSGGDYYHMGSEYSFPITLVGDTSFRGTVKIPVVANTIYNYQLMNGLGGNDMKFGLHQNWGVYGLNATVQSSVWECQTYPHLGVAHNYCNYVIDFTFHLDEPLTGAYNLNVGVIDFTGTRSAYYYSGYDSNGNAIEFPVASQNSGYPTLQPSLVMTSSGGSSGSSDNTEEILDGITNATDAITDTIQESYENLVKSQEVCSSINLTTSDFNLSGYFNSSGNIINIDNPSQKHTSKIKVYPGNSFVFTKNYSTSVMHYCFYNSSQSLVSCQVYDSNSISITIPNNVYYIALSGNVTSGNINSFVGNSCQNGNQAISDSILDDTIDDFIGSQQLDEIGGQLSTDTPITDLLALPITLIRAIITGINGTCSSFNLGALWGVGLTIPCINPELYLGSNLWNLIDLLFCGFMIFNIAQLMIHDFDSLSNAEDLFDETYTPRHEKVRRS